MPQVKIFSYRFYPKVRSCSKYVHAQHFSEVGVRSSFSCLRNKELLLLSRDLTYSTFINPIINVLSVRSVSASEEIKLAIINSEKT